MENSRVANYDRNMYLSYHDWDNIGKQQRSAYLQKLKAERLKKAAYYRRQRCFGFLFLVLGLVSVLISSVYNFLFLQGMGCVVLLLGVYIALTKQMIYMDSYYFECMDKINLM